MEQLLPDYKIRTYYAYLSQKNNQICHLSQVKFEYLYIIKISILFGKNILIEKITKCLEQN